MINLFFPVQFTHYLCTLLKHGQVPFVVHVWKEPQHQLDARLNYCPIGIAEAFKVYRLDSLEHLMLFSELIGGTSIFGIRKKQLQRH
jgi:hypothetical protein